MKKRATQVEELKKKMEQRSKEVSMFYELATYLLKELGMVLVREERRFHTKEKLQLFNFHGYSFFAYYGHSEMGGNDIEIRKWEKERPQQGKLLLKIYFQGASFIPEKGIVETFDCTETQWRNDLKKMVSKKSAFIERFRDQKSATVSSKEANEASDAAFLTLLQQARRLGLNV